MGRSATIEYERERLDGRRSHFDLDSRGGLQKAEARRVRLPTAGALPPIIIGRDW